MITSPWSYFELTEIGWNGCLTSLAMIHNLWLIKIVACQWFVAVDRGGVIFGEDLNLKNKARIFLVFESCCNRNRYICKPYFGRHESCLMTHSDKKSVIQKKLHPSHSIRYEIFPSGEILLPITRKPFFGKQMKMMISWKWLIFMIHY